ncbi:putative membrane protein [Escherichia coli TW14301]|nr:putative membrane protein [Escherichia coli TW14301]EKW66067.1 putative membrane protein [Escherichia coli 96.0932]
MSFMKIIIFFTPFIIALNNNFFLCFIKYIVTITREFYR